MITPISPGDRPDPRSNATEQQRSGHVAMSTSGSRRRRASSSSLNTEDFDDTGAVTSPWEAAGDA